MPKLKKVHNLKKAPFLLPSIFLINEFFFKKLKLKGLKKIIKTKNNKKSKKKKKTI